MSLKSKKIHELRAIAQGMGIKFNFGMTKEAMIQSIEAGQVAMIPKPVKPDPVRVIEGTLQGSIRSTLKDYIDRGLRLEFPTDATWRVSRGIKEDSGHISAKMSNIIEAAKGVM